MKTNRKFFYAGWFLLILLVSLLVSACRSVQPEEEGETDSELKPKRRTVLIDADSFSPGAYLPFNASCFDCFLFPTFDVNGVYLNFAPTSLIEDIQGDPMCEITQVNGIHCFLVSPRFHRTNGLFLGVAARPKTIVSGTKTKDQEVLVMDSMQSVTVEDVRNGASYLDIMRANLSVLTQALH